MSICGLPNLMPALAISFASSITFAACSNAFDGMQPTLKQTPPSCGHRSIKATSCRDRRRETPRCSRRGLRRARRHRSRMLQEPGAAVTDAERSRSAQRVRSLTAPTRRSVERCRRSGGGVLFGRGLRVAVLRPARRFLLDVSTTLPFDTRSPFLTATDFTTPAADAGTSIVSLLGLERNQRRFERDRVARFHEHVDDFYVFEVADVGNGDDLRITK